MKNDLLNRAAVPLFFLALGLLFLGRSLLPASGLVLGGYDMQGYYYVLHQAVRTALTEGRLPLWTPYMFNGYPLFVDPQAGIFYPPAWLTLVLPVNVGISWYILFHIWLASLGMYLFTRHLGPPHLSPRHLGARRLPALLAGIIFAYSGLLGGRLWAGHSTVYATDAWTPWLVLSLAWAVRRRTWWAAVLAGIPFGLGLLAGHLPSFLYVGLIWAAFAAFLLLTEQTARRLVLRQASIMAAVGLALAAVQLLPFLQFSAASARVAEASYEFATDYSLPPAHLITLIVPQFFGEPTTVGYWSVPTFEELTYYAGVIVFLGLALALARPSRLGWFYLALAGLGLWLALGRYGVLYGLFYDWLLPFRVTRAPARAAFLYIFAAAGLLAHTLSAWRAAERPAALARLMRWLLSAWAIAGIAALAATGAVFMAVHPTDTSGRLWQQIGGYTQALVIFLAGGGLVAAYLTGRFPGRRRLLAAALVLLVTLDMWLFAQKFVRLEPIVPNTIWSDGRAVLATLPPNASGPLAPRILPWGLAVYWQNGGVATELPSMFGYESLEPETHVALARSVADPRSSAYDVLGANYVLAAGPLDQFTEGTNGLIPAGQQGAAWVYRRPAALPLARLVYQTEIIADSPAAVSRVHQPDFNAAATAILAAAPPCDLGPAPAEPGTADVIAAGPGRWQIETASTAPALLVLAESAYPGWQVSVDGRPAAALTAYTTIKAVCIPAGTHVVDWAFRPAIIWWGGIVSLLALLLVGAAIRTANLDFAGPPAVLSGKSRLGES